LPRLDLATDAVALQSAMNSDRKLIFRYRLSLGSFIFGLIVSGLTALALELETALLNRLFGIHQGINPASIFFKVRLFISVVHYAIHDTYTRFPFLVTERIGSASVTLLLPRSSSCHLPIQFDTGRSCTSV